MLIDFHHCNRCGSALRPRSADGGLEWLHCAGCRVVPVHRGFAYFTEAFDDPGDAAAIAQALVALTQQLDAATATHAGFVASGNASRNMDIYAAFEPFNEASRALHPLLESLRAALAPSDLIVDLWCRTGWTGALLAGLFPEQKVLSFWDRPANVLGYAGFEHWLGAAQRAPNWHVAFASPGERLPLAAGCAALVHGADCVHRFEPDALLAEALRIARADGALLFPHVHLSNRDPEPFFERGGTIRPGRFYSDWFAAAPALGARKPFVLSEQKLFAARPLALHDEHDGDYCNALIAVLPAAFEGRELAVPPLEADATLLVNPLLHVDAVDGIARYAPESLSGHGEYLLDRHPVYRRRLEARLPYALDDVQRGIVHLAAQGHASMAIRTRLALDASTYRDAVARLVGHEVLQAAPVGAAMARLHRYYATRQDAPAPDAQHFGTLWQMAAVRFGERPVLISDDDSAFRFEELDELVAAVAMLLRAEGVAAGERIALISTMSVEALLLLWAAWRLGVSVVPLNPALDTVVLANLLGQAAPRLLFCEPAHRAAARDGLPLIEIGAAAETSPARTLARSLEAHLGSAPPPPPADAAGLEAVVLYTSGSSGAPKGVVLTQGALFRSAQALSDALGWRPGDVLWSLGGPHAMSGLRNPALAALAGAVTVFVPSSPQGHPAVVAEQCRRWGVTLLSTVPAFLTQLRELLRGGSRPRFGALRSIAVTGAPLGLGLQTDIEQGFGLDVRFYYGLTETSGVCFAVPTGEPRVADGDIGRPAAALSRIVDDEGVAVAGGSVGHLQVFSANLTHGYLHRADATARLFDRDWLRTGDLAREQDGHVVLLGRRDYQIKDAAGEIVQIEAVESLLEALPGVTEAAVVAQFEGDLRGLVGFVACTGDAHAPLPQLEALLQRVVANSRIRTRVVLVANIPRLPDGKLDRLQLQKLADA